MKVAIFTDLPFWYDETMYLNEIEKKLNKLGITAKIFVMGNPKTSGFFEKIGFTQFIKILKMLKKISEYDIIHIQFTMPLGFVFSLFSSLRILKKPMIIHTHGFDVYKVPKINYGFQSKFFGRFLTKFSWNRANKIIAVCTSAKSEIKKNGIIDNKINVIYNGIDENRFINIRDEIPTELSSIKKDSDFIFLSVASSVPVKNHIVMINAFQAIVKKYHMKKKIKLVLIGPYNQNTSQDAKSPHIHYLGRKSHAQLSKFYSYADAFVLPSLSEAHPWSLLEAMSCELPVIASNVGGIPETLEDTTFLCDPLDQNDILQKFEQIVEMSEAERKKIGVKNRERVLNRFTLDRHVTQLKRLYDEVI